MEALGIVVVVLLVAVVVLALWLRSLREMVARQAMESDAAAQSALQRISQGDAVAHAAQQRVAQLETAYGPIAFLADRERMLKLQVQKLEFDAQTSAGTFQTQQREFAARLAELKRTVEALDEEATIITSGFYKPRYDFGSSAEYERRLDDNREEQKALIKQQRAVLCTTTWSIDGNRKAGEKMVREYIKLMLRAFNGECDTAVLKVRYNNIEALENRVQSSFDAINKIAETNACQITQAFLDLKMAELRLVHEYQLKKQQEAEDQRAIREQMKEDERAQRELEKARSDADKEKERFEAALEKARAEAENASGKARAALEDKVAELTRKLSEAQQKQKAISQAQLTTSGHVYVISNIGAFGERVYKIGMTRRLDPMDRVIELGDASVPFPFDVHAMVFSEHAPELERKLHQRFAARRLNKVNERREFFEVGLEEIEAAVQEVVAADPTKHPRLVTFTRLAAAEEYRKSLAMVGQTPESRARARAVPVA